MTLTLEPHYDSNYDLNSGVLEPHYDYNLTSLQADWNLTMTITITSPNLGGLEPHYDSNYDLNSGVLEPHYDYNLTSLQADWNLTATITSPHLRRIGTSLRI